MHRLPRVLLGLALAAGAAGIPAALVRADVTVSLSPSILSLDGTAGGEGTVEIQIANNGDEPFEAAVELAPEPRTSADWSAVDWLSVEKERVAVEPDEVVNVKVNVSIPDGVPSGGRYAAVHFVTGGGDDAEAAADESRIGIEARVVVPVRIAVVGEGDLVVEPTVARFAPVLESDGRIGFRAEVGNAGNVHEELGGVIEIGTSGQEPIASVPLGSRTVLPEESVVLRTEGTLPLPAAETYTATLQVVADDADAEPVGAAATFGLEPALDLGGANVCENIGRGPTIASTLENSGDLGIEPQVLVELRDADGEAFTTAPVTTEQIVWPNERAELSVDMPGLLTGGEYSVVTRVTYGYEQVIEQETAFQIGGDSATAAPLCETQAADDATPEAGA